MIKRFTARILLSCLLMISIVLPAAAQRFQEKPPANTAGPSADPATYNRKMEDAGILFTANKGQVADDDGRPRPDILFTAHNGSTQLFITATGIHYQFRKLKFPEGYIASQKLVTDRKKQADLQNQVEVSTHRFTMMLEGANPDAHIRREEKSVCTENFYLPVCPQGIADVPLYGRIVYEDIYEGIDWVIYSNGKGIKYDFIVHPGADYRQIRLHFEDADDIRLDGAGALHIKTRLGTVTEGAPASFCTGKPVKSSYVLDGNNLHFIVGSYDHKKTLRIDPYVSWATYYGGAWTEGYDCAVDGQSNVYLTGQTAGVGTNYIATSGGFQTSTTINSGAEAYLAKFNSGGVRLWGTYYGGLGQDYSYSCAADHAGNVYIAGNTTSTTVIAFNGFQNTYAGTSGSWFYGDGFIAKFTPAGSRIWGTYYGGANGDEIISCAVDSLDNLYVAGSTTSVSGIAMNGHQNTAGNYWPDAFLAKFNPAGSRVWGTYYAGANSDYGQSCAVSGAHVYLSGITSSTTGIAWNGSQNTLGGIGSADCYLAQFDLSGNRIWGTYYGNTGSESGGYCAASSTQVCIAGSYQQSGIQYSFIKKYTPNGTSGWFNNYPAAWNSSESINDLAIDANNNIYAIGSNNGVYVTSIFGMSMQKNNMILRVMNADGAGLWGAYIGEMEEDNGYGISVDTGGFAYIAGTTESQFWMTYLGHQNSHGGLNNGYLMRIRDTSRIIAATYPAVLNFCTGAAVNVGFSAYGSFLPGNTFVLQLSDAVGSFTTPTAIGSTSCTSGNCTVSGLIPLSLPAGTGYLLRIVSTNPVKWSNYSANVSIQHTLSSPGAISGNTPVCTGTPQTYSIAPVPGATSYNWSIPATWTGTSNTAIINTIAGSSGGVFTVTATNSCGTTAPAALAVASGTNNVLIPSVSVSANSMGFCSGVPATFTATAVNGGTNPFFQWKKNGINAGSNSSSYTDPAPQTGTVITVEITSTAPCAAPGAFTSNSITESVTPSVAPGININTYPPHILCAGSPIQFVTNITAGGASPQYTWYKNGLLLSGVTTPTYTDPALQNGDTLQVFLTSSEACPATQPTPSNKRGVTVIPIVTTQVNITASPGTNGLTTGTPVTFTAAYSGGGAAPVFTWRKNGVTIPAITGPIYTTTFTGTPAGLSAGDQITVRMFSDDPCPSSPVVMSNALNMNPPTSTGSLPGNWPGSLTLHPNPAAGHFTIEGSLDAAHAGKKVRIDLINTLGQKVYTTETSAGKSGFSVTVILSDAVANGLYQLRVTAADMQAVKPVVILR